MAAVWKRPSLMGVEILWRWCAGVPLLAMLWVWGSRVVASTPFDWAALRAMTFFRSVDAAETMNNAFYAVLPAALRFAAWFVPLAVVVWTLAGAIGRGVVGRRLRPGWHRATAALFVLGLLRTVGVCACLGLWMAACLWAARVAIAGPVMAGGEPNVVLYMAIVIVSSIGLFAAWAVASGPLGFAQLLAMRDGTGAFRALGEAVRMKVVRGPLAEISLVMCIVRIALLVLGLVFSACPLPFESVETQGFLWCWWAGVTVLYLAMSDYFHVVRWASYLTLLPESAS